MNLLSYLGSDRRQQSPAILNATSIFSNEAPVEPPIDDPSNVHGDHPWGIFFTVLGTVLLDFDADACQSPSRAYLLDVTVAGRNPNPLPPTMAGKVLKSNQLFLSGGPDRTGAVLTVLVFRRFTGNWSLTLSVVLLP